MTTPYSRREFAFINKLRTPNQGIARRSHDRKRLLILAHKVPCALFYGSRVLLRNIKEIDALFRISVLIWETKSILALRALNRVITLNNLMALSFFCLNYPLVCFLLFKRYAFEVVQKFGCISDPKGYVLGRFQVKGKTPGRPCGGVGGRDG